VRGGVLDQRPTHAPAGGPGVHRHLLDVQCAVHRLGQEVADRPVAVGRRPGEARLPVPVELGGRQRLVPGDLGHPHVGEDQPRGPLDVLRRRQLVRRERTDHRRRGHVSG
jgi:hypothetical protein